MRWLISIVALSAITMAQLNASYVTYIADGPEANISTSTGANGFGDYYIVPGSSPTVKLIDQIARQPSQAQDALKLYQAIFTASIQVCSEFPTDVVRKSFRMEVGDLWVSFYRVGPRTFDLVQYEDLCYALRGIGELITRDSLHYNVAVRVITAQANYVRADINIEPKDPSTEKPAVDVTK